MGKVYLVGAGPGDPELITLKGLRCIQEADVILYDRLINRSLLEYAKPDAELIYCGKLPGDSVMKQEIIHRLLINRAQRRKVVTRLKGGDPLVYGRGGEEAQALSRYGLDFEIVPGITAGIAAPAYAGIPVTHRDFSSSFALVTGHRRKGGEEVPWEYLAQGVDTLAIYMGLSQLSNIRDRLIQGGKKKATPVALIQEGTTKNQVTVVGTLENIVEKGKEMGIQCPVMVIVGEGVRLREEISWFKEKQAEASSTALLPS